MSAVMPRLPCTDLVNPTRRHTDRHGERVLRDPEVVREDLTQVYRLGTCQRQSTICTSSGPTSRHTSSSACDDASEQSEFG